MSVSYTHLDVYKRQVYGGPAPEAVKVSIQEMEDWLKNQEANKLK